MWNMILEYAATVLVIFSYLWIDNVILPLERKCVLFKVPHTCNPYPHPHTKARSSKTISTIFLKLSDIVPNNIKVTNLH